MASQKELRLLDKVLTQRNELREAATNLLAYLGPWIEDYGPEDVQSQALEALRAAIQKSRE